MKKQFCENCGSPISVEADFCDQCGKKYSSYNQNKSVKVGKVIVGRITPLFSVKTTVSCVVLILLAVISFFALKSQSSIQQQLKATELQLSTIASSTNQKLNQQSQELDQKTSEISKLETDIKTSSNSTISSNNTSGVGTSNVLSSLSPSVVKIVCDADAAGDTLDEGSGVLYHSESSPYGPYYVETNLHVVQTSDDSASQCIFAIYPDYTNTSNYFVYKTDGYQTYKSGVDMAILTPEISDDDNAGTEVELGQYAKELTSTTYCSSSSIGDHVSILGYPGVGGSSLTATDGIISGYEYDDGVRFIKTSAEIEHGNSGGVAIENSGCILGIPTFVDQGDISSIGRILDLNDLFSS